MAHTTIHSRGTYYSEGTTLGSHLSKTLSVSGAGSLRSAHSAGTRGVFGPFKPLFLSSRNSLSDSILSEGVTGYPTKQVSMTAILFMQAKRTQVTHIMMITFLGYIIKDYSTNLIIFTNTPLSSFCKQKARRSGLCLVTLFDAMPHVILHGPKSAEATVPPDVCLDGTAIGQVGFQFFHIELNLLRIAHRQMAGGYFRFGLSHFVLLSAASGCAFKAPPSLHFIINFS